MQLPTNLCPSMSHRSMIHHLHLQIIWAEDDEKTQDCQSIFETKCQSHLHRSRARELPPPPSPTESTIDGGPPSAGSGCAAGCDTDREEHGGLVSRVYRTSGATTPTSSSRSTISRTSGAPTAILTAKMIHLQVLECSTSLRGSLLVQTRPHFEY